VAVSIECARLLSQERANEQGAYRATLVFAAVSGEEQGLLGGSRLLEWARQQGYTVGGMLDDDIVGAGHVARRRHGLGEKRQLDAVLAPRSDPIHLHAARVIAADEQLRTIRCDVGHHRAPRLDEASQEFVCHTPSLHPDMLARG